MATPPSKSGTGTLTDLQIGRLVERYDRERDRFEKMAATVSRILSKELREQAVPHLPTYRAKAPRSLSGKLERDRPQHQYADFDRDFYPSLLDLSGVRILLYRRSDLERTCATIESAFTVPTHERFRRNHDKPNGYRAHHRVVKLRPDTLAADSQYSNLYGVYCEIQVVTLADHIWNELEHDIRYKTPDGQPSPEQLNLLRVLNGQVTSMLQTVDGLMDATERQRGDRVQAIESAEDLRAALKRRCGIGFQGDLKRMLSLLEGVLREVTAAELQQLPVEPTQLAAARARLKALGQDYADDAVELVVSSLWDAYGKEFVEIVGSWPGRPGPIARAVHALEQK